MNSNDHTRRDFLKVGAGALAAAAGSAAAFAESDATIQIDPTPRFELSPYLYMQFMEPLGTTDGSVSASWDYRRNKWRDDLIETTRELSPTLMRWGGCLSSYYRWKEGVGPRDTRKPMLNLLWGGVEPNQVGTHEFVDFCRKVGADPLLTVNFESDGRKNWAVLPDGERRWGDSKEAAEWVDYCNNPDNALRVEHGVKDPYNVKLWQIGNETSYDRNGFSLDVSVKKTIEFAKAMKGADPSIKLIGWGDSGWAKPTIEGAGEYLDYVAVHHMYNPDGKPPVLAWNEFRKDPDRTWDQLMNAYKAHENKIRNAVEQVAGTSKPLALTECHYTVPGKDRCDVMSTWATGVSYARLLNVHERYGDVLKIATAADFCGTRWQVNAVMVTVPGGKSYLMPVAQVMRLYRKYSGEKFVTIERLPDGLDATASRTENKLYLHVVNTNRTKSVECRVNVSGMKAASGTIHQLCVEPEFEINEHNCDELDIREKSYPASGLMNVPAASVSAIVLEMA